jgi:DNA-binding MarR family transcriptional regulator
MASKRGKEVVPEQEAFISILRTAELLDSEFSRLLKPKKLTNAAYNVLRILRGAGKEGLACGDISDRMINRDPDITRLVDRLEKRGLAARERQTDDRRVVKVVITPAGLALLSELDEPVIETHKQQLKHVSKKRLAELMKLLAVVRNR